MPVAVPLLTLFLAAAAQTGPTTSDAPLAPVATPSRFHAKVSDPLLAPLPPPPVVLTTWQQARDLLRKNSVDERSAEAAVERAAGRWRQSLGVLLPNVGATAQAGIDLIDPIAQAPLPTNATQPLVSLSAGVTQSLVDVSAWRGLDSAAAAQKSSEATLSDVRRRLTLGLARGLVAVAGGERVAELNRLGLEQALERVALTERTNELGAATQLDVVRVRQDAEVARGTLVAGDEQLLRAREALAQALGIPGSAAPSSTFKLDGLIDEVRAVCRTIPWESRPDLVAARENTASARASRQQANASYLPTLRAASNATAYSSNPGLVTPSSWNLVALLTIPIWDGGIREGVVRERRGLETQAEAAAENTRRTVAVEVQQAARRVATAEALLESARRGRQLAAETDTLTRRAFEVGRGSSLELVQTAQALRQADVLLATREFELVQARLDAYLTEAQCDG